MGTQKKRQESANRYAGLLGLQWMAAEGRPPNRARHRSLTITAGG